MKSAFIIVDENGRQVFGLDNDTQLSLYRRGDREFSIGHGLKVKITCELPNARDARSQENGGRQSATPHGEETTSHRIGTFLRGLLSFG
jgi:hypothetical protein